MVASLLVLLAGCSDYSLSTQEVIDDLPPDDVPATVVPPETPIANCSVAPNPVTPPFEAATFDGSLSDPNGGSAIVNWNWELSEKPAGSAATMPGGDAIRSGFLADNAGLYVGRLTVTNADGVSSEACEAELEAIPSQDLWVEMYWDQAGDDMDLHLLAPGGAPNEATDCYYANCQGGGLDWGTPGFAGDDPALDLDDIPGTGPENINISEPSGGGGYTVMVHDYGASGDPQSTNVTVNVYLSGALVWSDTRLITGDLSETYFAQIDWQSGTVTTL